MNTLQRSSYSFRRQGSSGRIWDNRLTVTDLKSGELNANTNEETKNTQERESFKELSHPFVPLTATKNNMKATKVVSTLSSTSGHQKNHWSRVSSIFTRCMGFQSPMR